MKHIFLPLISAACVVTTLNTYAATSTPPIMKDANIPMTSDSGITFTLGALYLRPSSSNLDYASTSLASTAILTTSSGGRSGDPVTGIQSIDPNHGLAFLFGAGYAFKDTLNDFQVNWMHFNRSSDDDFSMAGSSSIPVTAVPPIVLTDAILTSLNSVAGNTYLLSNIDAATVEGKVTYKVDVVDFTFGQMIPIGKFFGNSVKTHLFGGLRYALIKNELEDTYSGTDVAPGTLSILPPPAPPTSVNVAGSPFTETATSFSKFQGVGPVFGADGSVDLGSHFHIVGSIDFALLVGTEDFNQSDNTSTTTTTITGSTSTATTVISSNNFDYDNVHRIVPALDGRLGIAYSVPFRQKSELSAELGYQVSKYFDAIDQADYFAMNSRDSINFGLDGAYFKVMFKA